MPRVQGRVKWFSSEKGYGFIEREGAEDVFVHHSEISMDGFRTLDAGELVEFEVKADDRGPKAHDVRRLEAEGAGGRESVETSPSGPRARRSGSPGSGPADRGAGRREESGSASGKLTLVEQIRRKLGGRFFD